MATSGRHALFLDQELDEAGEVHPQRHRDDVGALVDGPLDGVDDLVAGAAVAAEHLADEGLGDARRHADARVLDVAAEDRAGAVRAVTVLVAVAVAGEVRSTRVTPAKAAWAESMPVSSTATAMPAPVNGEVSARTALMPQVAVAADGVAVTSLGSPIGAMSRIGIAGAMARTPLLRSMSRASRGSSSSIWYSMRGIGAAAAPAGPAVGPAVPPLRGRVARSPRRTTYFCFMCPLLTGGRPRSGDRQALRRAGGTSGAASSDETSTRAGTHGAGGRRARVGEAACGPARQGMVRRPTPGSRGARPDRTSCPTASA